MCTFLKNIRNECNPVRQHKAIRTNVELEVTFRLFVTSTLNRAEWSASSRVRFTQRKEPLILNGQRLGRSLNTVRRW
jgi:hypothetical protein